jgi:hypothetical protein
MLAFIGGEVGGGEEEGVGAGPLAGTGGAWSGAAGELGAGVGMGVEDSSVSSWSFSSFFFFPNRVSIPMTVKRDQMGSRLVSRTSIHSTHI